MFSVHPDVDVTRPISEGDLAHSLRIADRNGHILYKDSEGRSLCTSASEPGRVHNTTHLGCSCKGFYFRGYCSHWSKAVRRVVRGAELSISRV